MTKNIDKQNWKARKGREGQKLQKLEYFKNEKSFFDEMEKRFSWFLKGSHLVRK